MAYRNTPRYLRQLANMREAKARKRLADPAPDHLPELPDLRRRIVITDYDFGERIHTLDLYRTNRSDCYRVVAGLRKSMPRVSSQMD